ncbi:two component transcriptional regulator, winged helix family [Desulfosporosinus sp. I2]|nr:two component transcriptional regulator, winged helix family [Desulfosporosinus sp. I2]
MARNYDAVLRRLDLPEGQKTNSIHYPGLTINLTDYEVMILDKPINLTKKEIEILWILASNPGKGFFAGQSTKQCLGI